MARTKSKRGSKKSTRGSIRDRARKAAEKRERGGGGLDTLQNIPQDIEFFKPKMGRGKKGQNRFSIVPYVVSIDNHPFQDVGEMWPECTYWQHKIGSGSDQKRFICLSKTEQSGSKKCPICEYRQALLNSGSDPDLADELKPKQRQLFNIYDHDNEDKGIQLLEMSPYMFGHMLDDEDKAQAEDFDDKYYGDYEDGLMIVARFNEESFGGNKFPECARIDFEERDDLDESMVTEDAVDLDACLRILSYDELNEKFFELDGEESDEEEEEESKPKRSSRRSSKRKDEEPDEVEEDEEEEDEEEEDEDDIPSESEIKKMKSVAIKKYIKENDLDIEVKGLSLSDLREELIDCLYPEEEEEEEEETDDENECPEGMTFGEDCDSDDVCDDCDKWEDCKDLQDEIEAAVSKKKSKRSRK